jgi:UDP-hydrolysing UDP-N-acetyl-D-glucosamine 2-epimerase
MTTLLAAATRKIPRSGKRRICFPITSRAYYGRSQLLIRKLHAHPEIELELMLGGSILLDKYSRHIADDIEAGGFTIRSYLNVIEGGNHVAMAKTVPTALEFTNGLHTIDPEIVIICGDRFEQLAIAMATAYLNITIAHIEGGDLCGSIDESVRHAITKLAHLHFVTNADAKRRVLAMGEDPRYVYNTGSLDIEVAARVETVVTSAQINTYGVGHTVDLNQPFPHGAAASGDDGTRQSRAHPGDARGGFRPVCRDDLFWPNPDAGRRNGRKPPACAKRTVS